MPCVCMLTGCLNLFKLSGIGLDLACNLTVLLFLVYTLHGSSHYYLTCFLLHETCSVLTVDAVLLSWGKLHNCF